MRRLSLRQLAGSLFTSKKPARRRPPRGGLGRIESLESRRVLTPIAAGIDFDAATGIVTVDAGNAAADIDIYNDTAGGSPTIVIDGHGVDGVGVAEIFAADVTQIRVYGKGGNDTVVNNTSVKSRLDGGAGHDDLTGGFGDDTIYGGDGNDKLNGRAGKDMMLGGWGKDTMSGGSGDDWMWGDYGFVLFGSPPTPPLFVSNNDVMDGGSGNDLLSGQDGDDFMIGGWGQDTMYGGDGDDSLLGDYFSIFGTPTPPLFVNNADVLEGGDGKDNLYGQYGNDKLDGGDDAFKDNLYGGSGADEFDQHYFWWFGQDNLADYNAGAGDTIV